MSSLTVTTAWRASRATARAHQDGAADPRRVGLELGVQLVRVVDEPRARALARARNAAGRVSRSFACTTSKRPSGRPARRRAATALASRSESVDAAQLAGKNPALARARQCSDRRASKPVGAAAALQADRSGRRRARRARRRREACRRGRRRRSRATAPRRLRGARAGPASTRRASAAGGAASVGLARAHAELVAEAAQDRVLHRARDPLGDRQPDAPRQRQQLGVLAVRRIQTSRSPAPRASRRSSSTVKWRAISPCVSPARAPSKWRPRRRASGRNRWKPR